MKLFMYFIPVSQLGREEDSGRWRMDMEGPAYPAHKATQQMIVAEFEPGTNASNVHGFFIKHFSLTEFCHNLVGDTFLSTTIYSYQ